MTEYLGKYMELGEEAGAYVPATSTVNTGVAAIGCLKIPSEDRNRTSPFPYGGMRFEFRAAGSSQNVSLVNTVLATMVAHEFAGISAKVEAGQSATDVARDLLKTHMRVVFNGNGYDETWPSEAEKLGLYHIPSGVDAINKLSDEKNKELFSSMGVFTPDEVEARKAILLELYIGTVEMEVLTMADMIKQHVAPSALAAGLSADEVLKGAEKILGALDGVHKASDLSAGAALARTLRLDTMVEVRKLCDDIEAEVPADKWTLATYKELLFMDSHENEQQYSSTC